jgi:hypothetical protein
VSRGRRKVTELNSEPKLTQIDEYTMRIFEELITQVHNHLEEAKLQILYRNDPKWSRKFEVNCVKGVMLFLTGFNFSIVINRYALDAMTVREKYAFIDLVLCYCAVRKSEKGDLNWYKAKPNVEGFLGNYQRFGEWTQTYKTLKSITNQLNLFDNGGAVELAREANEMRALKDYYELIDRLYGNKDAFPHIREEASNY